MPIPVMDPVQTVAALKLASSDLRFVFEENQVSEAAQAHLTTNGITTLKRLSTFGHTEEAVRKGLKEHLNLDEAESMSPG